MVAAGLLTILSINPAWPATPPAAKPTEKMAGRELFRSALASVAEKNHLAVVVEGEPTNVVVAHFERQAMGIPTSQWHQASTVAESIGRIANAFDYDVFHRGNVYSLVKRYTYPEDIPGITPLECAAAAGELGGLLKSVVGRGGGNEGMLRPVVDSMTADQWKLIASQHYLRINADLTDEQREAISQFVQFNYFRGGNEAFNQIAIMLGPNGRTRFTYDKTGLVAITHVIGSERTFDYTYPIQPVTPLTNMLPHAGAPASEENDAVPGEADANQAEPAQDQSHIAITLRQAVDELNQDVSLTNKRTGRSDLKYTVDSALAAKPVTLIGAQNATPIEIASALAGIYGLRLQRSPDRPTIENITAIPVSKFTKPTDLPMIGHELIPTPIQREMQVGLEDELRSLPTYNPADTSEKLALMKDKWNRHAQIRAHRDRVLSFMTRQLMALLRGRLAVSPLRPERDGATASVDLTALDAQSQSIFAAYCFSKFCDQNNMDDVLYSPWLVAHADDTALVLGHDSYQGRPTISVGVCQFDPEKEALGQKILYTAIFDLHADAGSAPAQ